MSAPQQILEAVLFASGKPMSVRDLSAYVPPGTRVGEILQDLEAQYAERGIRLVRRGDKYALRTAPELAPHLQKHVVRQQRLSRAALEVLAIIAWHQPVTRAQIEALRGSCWGMARWTNCWKPAGQNSGRRAPARGGRWNMAPASVFGTSRPANLASLPPRRRGGGICAN